MLERHVLFIMDLNTIFFFSFVALFAYFCVFGPFTIKEICIVFRKSACPFRQVKTKMYLPESPFFQKIPCQGKRASTYVSACWM